MSGSLRLGFVRGSAPTKWARRWQEAQPESPLELVPLDESPLDSAAGQELLASGGLLLVRGASTEPPRFADPLHAVRLYDEAVALVTTADAELGELPEISDLDLLRGVSLLQHPAHNPLWPKALPWQDPSWEPRTAAELTELVATGQDAALLPLPLARHTAKHKQLRVIPVAAELGLAQTAIWAVWLERHNSDELQNLVGVLRGRRAASSRQAAPVGGSAPKARKVTAPRAKSTKKTPPPGSRGEQLLRAAQKNQRRQGGKAATAGKRTRRSRP